MLTVELPSYDLLKHLFDLLESENPDLVPGCRWLLFGPELAQIVLPEEDEPTLRELANMLKLLREQAPGLREVAAMLARSSEHAEAVHVELCVDQMLAHSDWEHPTQVLERPRPDLTELLAACQERLESAPDSEREVVAAMAAKVERAVRIAESARERRKAMRRGRRRRRSS